MQKDFDKWNNLKKGINERQNSPFCNDREIWWCSIGQNVGSEEDGKNELFERPILVLKVFNKQMIRVAPLTSKIKNDNFHFQVSYGNRIGMVIISQIKTISTKRLSRKIGRISKEEFGIIKEFIKKDI